MPLSRADRALVQAADDAIRRMYVPEWHHIGAAVRTPSGRVYTAVNMDTYVGRCAVCAETVALGKAYSEGERAFDTVAAVRWIGRGAARVVVPCGGCRELLVDYGDPWVIHPRGKVLARTRASALLPDAYARPGEARGDPATKRPAAGSRGRRGGRSPDLGPPSRSR